MSVHPDPDDDAGSFITASSHAVKPNRLAEDEREEVVLLGPDQAPSAATTISYSPTMPKKEHNISEASLLAPLPSLSSGNNNQKGVSVRALQTMSSGNTKVVKLNSSLATSNSTSPLAMYLSASVDSATKFSEAPTPKASSVSPQPVVDTRNPDNNNTQQQQQQQQQDDHDNNVDNAAPTLVEETIAVAMNDTTSTSIVTNEETRDHRKDKTVTSKIGMDKSPLANYLAQASQDNDDDDDLQDEPAHDAEDEDEDYEDEDAEERMDKHGRPVRKSKGFRYSLERSKKGFGRAVSAAFKFASERRPSRKQKNKKNDDDDEEEEDVPVQALLGDVPAENNQEAASSEEEGQPFKVFLLLILPKSKIFELIQVIYTPNKATIGDLLAMIPQNATEPILGSHAFAGFCRPDDGNVITDCSLAASSSNDDEQQPSANIQNGEVLIAVPQDYDGPTCARITKPILANPKIIKLLEKSDPMAAPKRFRKKKRGEPNPGRRRRRRGPDDNDNHDEKKDNLVGVQVHVKKSSTTAPRNIVTRATDASVGSTSRTDSTFGSLEELDSAFKAQVMAEAAQLVEAARMEMKDAAEAAKKEKEENESVVVPNDESLEDTRSFEESLDSLDSAFTFRQASRRAEETSHGSADARQQQRRNRRNRRKTIGTGLVCFVLAFMIAIYQLETNTQEQEPSALLVGRNQAMGFIGVSETAAVMLVLVVMQRYHNKKGTTSRRRRPNKA